MMLPNRGTTCIVGVDDDPVLKDFIRVHVERLAGPKVCLQHWYPDYRFNGRTVRYFHSRHPHLRKLQKLLPQVLYSRAVTRNELSDKSIHDALAGFLESQKVDVILAEFGPAGADICRHARALGIPLVVHFHGHDAHRTLVVEEYRDRYQELFGYAHALISVSNHMTSALVRLGADPARIVYNPYGPRERFFEVRPDYGGKAILSLGRFTDIKANYLTLMAFRIVLEAEPDASLVMVGGGELLETCRTLAKLWGIADSVSFPGAVPHSEILPFFSRASCFVQHSVTPSYGDAEGTPVVILEAGAAGLPVVASRHAGIADVVVDKRTGFLVPELDFESMAERMLRLLRDPGLARQLGEEARIHVESHFSLDRHVATLQSTLDDARTRRHPAVAR